AGAPIDLVPPGEDARQVGHYGRDRHDRYGLLRAVLIDQNRHQHDRGAGPDDAGNGAGDEPDREDEEEIQRPCLQRIDWATVPHEQKGRSITSLTQGRLGWPSPGIVIPGIAIPVVRVWNPLPEMGC